MRKTTKATVLFLLAASLALWWFFTADYEIHYYKTIDDKYWMSEYPEFYQEEIDGHNYFCRRVCEGCGIAPECLQISTIEAEITAYSELDSCHYPGCVMANGLPAQIGYVACPREMELGTQVEIEGKTYVCGDRTAKRYDGRFDIFLGYGEQAYQEAVKFGIKNLIVAIK